MHLSEKELKEEYLINQEKINTISYNKYYFSYPFGVNTESSLKTIKECDVDVIFSSGGKINFNHKSIHYDRINMNATLKTKNDLLGYICWNHLRN